MAETVRHKLKQIARVRIRSAEERIQQILDERTERLAARESTAAAVEVLPRALVCGSGRERFGIPIAAVAEVLPSQECMPVPDGPSALIGLFGRSAKSAMFLLGAGERHPALHNPDYDFPDDLIPIGARVFMRAARNLLG